MHNFFSKPYFEKWIDQANPEIKDWFSKEINYLKGNILPNSKILDVGCGFGRHIEILAKFSAEVVGIDNDKNMFRKAKENLAERCNVNIFFQDAKKINFPDNYFDYVLCLNNTFGNFLNNKNCILKEMKRVCSLGGMIIVSVYSENSLDVRRTDYEKIGLHIERIEKGIVYTKEGLISEQFTKEQLAEIFNKNGLKASIAKLNSISYICNAEKRLILK